jgi:hypothetical protein
MRISFDLDDTLICYQPGVPREAPLSWWRRLFVNDEPLRLGARSLMRELAAAGCDLWIYTTSYRHPGGVRRWLRYHGIHVTQVINQDLHEFHLRRTPRDYPPSKNPRAFGIDLHVDDSDGVRMEGEEHGFAVVVVAPEDEAWTDKVRAAVAEWHRGRGEQESGPVR